MPNILDISFTLVRPFGAMLTGASLDLRVAPPRMAPIFGHRFSRTASEIIAHIVIPVNKLVILYKMFAVKAKQSHMLGMTYEAIGRSLKIGQETARKACHYEDYALLIVSL